jgi:beta-phosphoglucomutase-like phosphatase (HAD superfamily)
VADDRNRQAEGHEVIYDAAILDLDGVLTRTATQHARAWKEMFDSFLAMREQRPGEDLKLFDSERDYVQYVDGKPRFDGVRSFLRSRRIQLPEGADDDGDGRVHAAHGIARWTECLALGRFQGHGELGPHVHTAHQRSTRKRSPGW